MKAFAVFLAVIAAAPARAAVYGIADYLRDVDAKSPALAASREAADSYNAKAGEVDLAFSPFLSGSLNWIDDRKPPSTSFSPDRTLATSWSVALGQRLRTGTSLGLSYGMDYAKLFPLPPQPLPGSLAAFAPLFDAMTSAFLPLPSYTSRATVSVSQSIWQGIVLDSASASNDKVKAQANAGTLGERYRAAAVRFQAEEVYWRLSLLRRVLAEKQGSLERTKKMEDWAAGRVEKNFSDKSDLLQAQAGVRLRDVDLKGAEQDVLAAQRSFNSLRGRDGADVPEVLAEVADGVQAEAAPAQSAGDRLDVQAAAELLRAAKLGQTEARGRTSWDFSIFGSATFNGFESTASDSFADSLTPENPTWVAGGVLTVPLGFGRVSRTRKGYEADVRSAEDGLARARLDAARDWKDLLSRWGDTDTRLQLARELEGIQQEKASREQDRYADGRTTMYQVLAFEDDWRNSQLLTIRVGYERLVLAAQARLYGTR